MTRSYPSDLSRKQFSKIHGPFNLEVHKKEHINT
ncbi:hypothetical protein RHOW815_001269 [Candidatus Rhabdochlamydia sp. W815]|nr:hypothetical protein RHOW815_001269 [Candidatus Rhabdochlamydia sp. W815]